MFVITVITEGPGLDCRSHMLDDDGATANGLGVDETYIRAIRHVCKEHKRTSDPLFSYALSTNLTTPIFSAF